MENDFRIKKLFSANIFALCASIVLSFSVTYLLVNSWGKIPAIAPLLNPAQGIWRHQQLQWRDAKLPGLQHEVQIAIDPGGVFHIFAESDRDLYIAQGFVTAKLRLFQMDISTRVAAGRLSELVGERGREFDRYFTQFGMRDFSKSAFEKIKGREDVEAYVAGVNEAIRQLTPASLPPEYKLLNKWPQEFSSDRVANLLVLMSYNLAGRSFDLALSKIKSELGLEKTRDLFPEFSADHLESYIVAKPHPTGRDFSVSEAVSYAPHIKDFPKTFQPHANNGSNNFAIGPDKSTTGMSLVANDTHLGYSLPNVWLESHLVTPNLNVYGVSFPMGPGVVLGFNRKTAWAVTNGTTDVLDWFEIEFKDESSLEYRVGDEWKMARETKEEIPVKDSASEYISVVKTEFGYLLKREGKWGLVARWIGDKMGGEIDVLAKLNRSESFPECVEALNNWLTPTQNWICADANQIGILHRGWIPNRQTGEGQFVEPARLESWQKPIPSHELPQNLNPREGFVFSANERVAPRSYKYYMGSDYEDPARGQRIRSLLESKAKLSPEDLIQLQTDVFETRAYLALPILLKNIDRSALTSLELASLKKLADWNLQATANSEEVKLFLDWWWQLKTAIFPNEVSRTRLQLFIENLDRDPQHSDRQWIKTSFAQVILKSFQKALQSDEPRKVTVLPHVLKLPGFDSGALTMDGTSATVQANQGGHGPVYKLVVALGDLPQAWSMVPGGSNGDPFSPQYTDHIQEWAKGHMKRVYYWQTWSEAQKEASLTFTLRSGI